MYVKNKDFGILVHISSLPSPHGIGTLGKESYNFIDFLSSINASYWQILPLNVTSYGDSPYQSFSSVGLNYYFIDLDNLVEEKLLKKEEINDSEFFDNDDHVNYSLLFKNRIKILKLAFSRFNKKDNDFISFVKKKTYHDFAFFMALKEVNNFLPWYEFKSEHKTYSLKLEIDFINENYDLYLFYIFTQYIFLKQYNLLRNYAKKKNIKIIGDMPIYVAYDSIEAYKYPNLFKFDNDNVPILVSGCPPDEFSSDGQLWGNPIYNYEKMKEDNYSWFKERINYNLSLFDILRIDHFRGFSSYYAIPYGMKNARIGRWIDGPEMDIFNDFLSKPIIAEDLGFQDDKLVKFLNKCLFPGMKILQYAFDGNQNNLFKPENIEQNYIVYTGTHDNNTTLGYINSLSKDEYNIFISDVKKSLSHFKIKIDLKTKDALVDALIILSFVCKAKTSIIPIQDILHLDSSARMNVPSILNGINWCFRIKNGSIDNKIINKYKSLSTKYQRN